MCKKNKGLYLPQIYCNLFGHKFKISNHVTHHIKEYTCIYCKKKMTTNGNGQLTNLTPKYVEINKTLNEIHNKKLSRLKFQSQHQAKKDIIQNSSSPEPLKVF